MQYSSRLHIRVKTEKDWEKFTKLDKNEYKLPNYMPSKLTGTDFVFTEGLSGEELQQLLWECDEVICMNELTAVAYADSVCISVDNNKWAMFTTGNDVEEVHFEQFWNEKPGDIRIKETDINNLNEWFSDYFQYGDVGWDEEIEKLVSLGIPVDIWLGLSTPQYEEEQSKNNNGKDTYKGFYKTLIVPESTLKELPDSSCYVFRLCIIAADDNAFNICKKEVADNIKAKSVSDRLICLPEKRMLYCNVISENDEDIRLNCDEYQLQYRLDEKVKGKCVVIGDVISINKYSEDYFSQEGAIIFYSGDTSRVGRLGWDCFMFDEECPEEIKGSNLEVSITDLFGIIDAYEWVGFSLEKEELCYLNNFMEEYKKH